MFLCTFASILITFVVGQGDFGGDDGGYGHGWDHGHGHGHMEEVHHVQHHCHEEKHHPLIVKNKKHTIILGHGHGHKKNIIVDHKGDDKIVW